MARKKKHEDHVNHEAWAIPYGDLVTLLFALFTVMYALSLIHIWSGAGSPARPPRGVADAELNVWIF